MSYTDQQKLTIISEDLVDNIDELLNIFNIKLKKNHNKYWGGCPVHCGGEDRSPFNLFHTGTSYRGNWLCRSQNCHSVFKRSILGFLRGVLSHNKYGWMDRGDETVNFNYTIEWALNFLKKDYSKIEVDFVALEKKKFVQQTAIFSTPTINKQEKKNIQIGVDLSKRLKIPSQYFKNRGFCSKILREKQVGDCLDSSKPMFERGVVPFFDRYGEKLEGCAGRSIFEKCPSCSHFHNPESSCPSNSYEEFRANKWINSKGFNRESYLYNFSSAKILCKDGMSLTLVESPSNTWKLMQNGVGSVVAYLGSSLTDAQISLLTEMEILTINLIPDNDKAGKNTILDINSKLKNIFNINIIELDKVNDISEMTDEDIKKLIIPKIKRHSF